MNDSSYETRTRKCCFGCLAAAPLAQLFAAAAAGVTVAVLLAICHFHSVVDAGACTVIVLCAVAVAELSAAAADGGTVAVLLSSYLFLLSVAGACSCTVFFVVLLFFSGESPATVLALESGRSPHAEGQRPVPLERCWVLLRC